MPPYWLQLESVPKSPVGVGVTANNIADARGMLEAMEIFWHTDSPDSHFKAIATLSEIAFPFAERTIKRPIEEDGIWFPVFDIESIIDAFANSTAGFRSSKTFDAIREQFANRNVDPITVVVYDIRYTEPSNCLLLVCAQRDELLFIETRVHKALGTHQWILDFERHSFRDEYWDPENAIMNQIVDGRLRYHFESAVQKLDD